jgi:hypothetical protein
MANKNGSKKPPTPPADPADRARTALLYQLLETEMGGVQVYRTALQCALDPELKKEWTKYLSETERHVVVARDLLTKLGLDPDAEIPARVVCRHLGQGLVEAMLETLAAGTPDEAQLTAAECVVKAETKDHLNWQLLGLMAKATPGEQGQAMMAAHDAVESEEDHHLYHSTGWARELWAKALGLPAVLPPPEEQRGVESAMAAARAKNDREQMT